MKRQLKDKKVIIYEVKNAADAGDLPRLSYTPIHPIPLWAYIRQLSAKEFWAARAVQQTEDMIFTVNYRPDITPENVIWYKGIFYNITRVDTFEGYKDDLNLYATIIQNQPQQENILPYPEE